MRRALVAALLATAAATVVVSGVAPTSADAAKLPPGSAPYGLVASNANFVPGHTMAARVAAYRRLYDAGVRAIRLDINWTQVEPVGPPLHDYDFSAVDREVEAIKRAGLEVIGILDYGHPDYSTLGAYVGGTPVNGGIPPFYVASAQYYPPGDPRDFARYAGAVARHYEQRFPGLVIGWEVWNEENEGWRFWPPHEDPAAYSRLLCATYPRLKAATPRVPVLFGGVFFPAVADQPGMSGPDFVSAAYESDPGLGRCYDAMAYHPYPYPFTAPELDVPIRGSVLSAARQMRSVMAANGDGRKPLWITEVGWPTHQGTYGVPERKQAEYVARMSAATFAQGLPVLTWYTYGDYDDPTGANQEAHFGLFRSDGSPKPSYFALRTFARVFRGSRFVADRSRALGLPRGTENVGGRGFALVYRRQLPDGVARITALWLACESAADGQGHAPACTPPQSTRVALPVNGRVARVVSFLGRHSRVRARGGKLTLDARATPVYVIDRIARH